MRIAVTGASGFIGRHVLAELLRHEAVVVAATRDPAKLSGIGESIEVVKLDMSEAAPDAYLQLGRPDALIHLAWDGLPHYKSLHHFETELPRQYRFLRSMVDGGLTSMLVTGTCFEYGMQSGPLSETAPTQPDNPYGLAKDALRQQLEHLQSTHGFALTWARLFYMYGNGQPRSSLYPQLEAAVARGDRVFKMSGGEQLRDYLTVEEVACSIVLLALRPRNLGPVNICSGKPISVRRLVELWLQQRQWRIELELGAYPYPDHEPMAFWGDRARLDALLEAA